MPQAFSDDAKERVRQAVDIVDLVGDYVPLRREGRAYKALCPWHDDSRPSLQVNPERQSFRCWVCDIGGDVFSFLMKQENISFPEALQMLADRAGIQLAARDGETGQNIDFKRLQFQALAWAEQQYHDCLLRAPEAQPARDYLAGRALTDETIRRFKLGFSPDAWDWLINRALDTPYTPRVLESVGLLVGRQQGSGHYDRFRGRVLFSIRDPQQRPVGFGGRVLPGASDDAGAKYVNSPETPLFSKNRLLYGLDAAKDALSKSRTAIVMEGYTDCLIAQQCGFANAVAVLGTALGENHIRLLRRFVDRIILVLDGDEAGRRRTDQILELFVAEQMDLGIVTPPDELDPADFLLQRGAEAFSALLDGAVDALEHKFQLATKGLSAQSGLHAVTLAVENVLATLAKSPRLQQATTAAIRLREDQILHRMARRSGLHEDRLRQRLTELRRQHAGRTAARRADPAAQAATLPAGPPRLALAEAWLLQILIERPDFLPEIRQNVQEEQFRCERRRAIYALACQLADRGTVPSFDQLMLAIDDPALQNVLVGLDEERQAIGRSDAAKELRDLLTVFRNESLSRAPQPTEVLAAASASHADEAKQFGELVSRLRSRHGISSPTDG
ncbi:MAG TPA: DNA primase [Pirellulales bacterium]|nr:DNA primase [Pirellulales bacterium]